MSEAKFKIGEQVRLKGGQLRMTVTTVDVTPTCSWTIKGKPYSESYPQDALELAPKRGLGVVVV